MEITMLISLTNISLYANVTVSKIKWGTNKIVIWGLSFSSFISWDSLLPFHSEITAKFHNKYEDNLQEFSAFCISQTSKFFLYYIPISLNSSYSKDFPVNISPFIKLSYK